MQGLVILSSVIFSSLPNRCLSENVIDPPCIFPSVCSGCDKGEPKIYDLSWSLVGVPLKLHKDRIAGEVGGGEEGERDTLKYIKYRNTSDTSRLTFQERDAPSTSVYAPLYDLCPPSPKC